jgi:hypothetical protein
MKTDFSADFKKAKELQKQINEEITKSINVFMDKRCDFLVKRCQVNCPAKDVKLQKSIKKTEVKKTQGKIEFGIVTEGSPNATRVHEAPYKKTKEDRNTLEGGQGNKFISRPMEYHFSRTNEKELQKHMQECPVLIKLNKAT